MEHDFQVTIGATPATLQALRDNLMNNVVWPDFTSIPLTAPAMRYMEVTPEQEFTWDEYSITAYQVNHSVPAVGYCIRKGESCFIYTGDTGPTERIWEAAPVPSTLLIEVSFPNSMEDLARMTGHLTPSLLGKELAKMKSLPDRILITHLKPQFACRIADDLVELGIPRIELVHEGSVYNI